MDILTLGPLSSALSKASKLEKEELKVQITTVKEEMQKARKEALAEIVKAYKLSCNYFVGKARTQWDKMIQEMNNKDSWVAVNGKSYKGPCVKTWASFLDCIELHKLTIFSCDITELHATTCNKVSTIPSSFQFVHSWREWAFSMTTWPIYLWSRTVQWLLKTQRRIICHSTRPT